MKGFFIKSFIFLFLYFLFLNCSICQTREDSTKISDSVSRMQSGALKNNTVSLDSFLKKNKYLNLAPAQTSFITKQKSGRGKEILFYLLAVTVLLLAIFKVFYSKYFNNIFRAFFNTSLRQNQLTDLLLQAKLPSLIFNVFFTISIGLYVWLVANYHSPAYSDNYLFAALSILFVAVIYVGKFISLKFIGWACGISEATDQYIFVIFLINKIIGILLIPFIVLLTFAPANWQNEIVITSLFLLGILFLLRYLRSYGLLQNQLKLNRFHFIIYIIAAEVLPALIIFKLLVSVIH